MAIRSSELGANTPMRQVTAQQYQAAVAPTAYKASGLEKLASFGESALQMKREIDQDVLKADMGRAADSFEDAIKSMDPSDFVKDPNAALEAAGIKDLYGLIDKAPIGQQAEMRKQIEYMTGKTTNAMQSAHAAREKFKATAYLVDKELTATGDVSAEHWGSVMSLNKDEQKHVVGLIAQTAITNGRHEVFDRMAADDRLDPELRDNVEMWKRQSVDRAEAKRKAADVEARRLKKERETAMKDAMKASSMGAAVGMVEMGMPIDWVLSHASINSSVKKDELEAAIYQNPRALKAARATGVLTGDRALITSAMNNPSIDGNPTPAFLHGAAVLQEYKSVRGGWHSLAGVGMSKTDITKVIAAEQLIEPGESFTDSLYRASRTLPANTIPVDSKTMRGLNEEADKTLTVVSQRAAYMDMRDSLMLHGVSPDKAHTASLAYVQKDTMDAGGVTLTGATSLLNIAAQKHGLDQQEPAIQEATTVAVDRVLAQNSMEHFGTNQPMEKWEQFTATDDSVIFRHSERPGLFVPVRVDDISKVIEEKQKADHAFGKSGAKARADNPEQYQYIGAGYPVRSLP